ncbi:MAG: LptF/LptG family permease [Elusimicrobiota bacterium]
MSLLGRYAVKRFLGPFFFGLGVFALVVFLADLFDKMNRLFGTKAPAWMVAEYLGLAIPYWTIRVVPMATLLATIFAVTGFMRGGEFIGVQASGVRPRDFFRPLLLVALLIAGAASLLQETVLPACWQRAQTLWRERIHPEWEWTHYSNMAVTLGPDCFVTTQLFEAKEGSMVRPVLDYYGPGGLTRQIDAGRARWDQDAKRWVFLDGVDRRYRDGIVVSEEVFKRLESGIEMEPLALVMRSDDPDTMSFRGLRSALEKARRMGERQQPLKTALQAKLAYPLTNLILCALGIPIALRLGRASRPASFAAALAVCFLYLWLIEAGRTLGNAGRMGAVPAAWLPHLVFGATALWMWRSSEV